MSIEERVKTRAYKRKHCKNNDDDICYHCGKTRVWVMTLPCKKTIDRPLSAIQNK